MSDELVIVGAIIYAGVVALSYSKVGFLNALFFPVTIVITGTLVYIQVVLMEYPEE